MPQQRKLGRAADQRQALLRNQVTNLIWHGRITTTLTRAKEVRSLAEKYIGLAVREYGNTVEVQKEFNNDAGQLVIQTLQNDAPSKLAVRRQMLAYLYNVPETKKKGESKSDYKERTKDVKHPVIEKLFRELGPKYDKRKQETGQGGGYTRMVRMGPRRGDAAEMVILELV